MATKEEKELLEAIDKAKHVKLTKGGMCALAHIYRTQYPDGQSKLLELAFQHENKDFIARDEKQGVDLVHRVTNAPHELKTATCARDKQGTANFVFPVRKKDESIDAYRKRVGDVQRAKGTLIIEVIVAGASQRTVTFTFSADFIAGFLESYPNIESGRVGIAVNLCKKCDGFHKLEYLLKRAAEFDAGKKNWDLCHKEVRGCQK